MGILPATGFGSIRMLAPYITGQWKRRTFNSEIDMLEETMNNQLVVLTKKLVELRSNLEEFRKSLPQTGDNSLLSSQLMWTIFGLDCDIEVLEKLQN